jgi:cell wall-associated NlpC family hydrolase
VASQAANTPTPLQQETVIEVSPLEDSSMTLMEKEAELSEVRETAKQKAAIRAALVEQEHKQQLYLNQILLEDTLARVLSRVGKTPYVFSGSTPSGWDCSGLVTWAYAQMNVELPHSASKQGTQGIEVTKPVPGDVVLFGNSNGIFHSAIYVGDGKVVHAGFKPGTRTEIISLDSPSFSGTTISFRRLLELP